MHTALHRVLTVSLFWPLLISGLFGFAGPFGGKSSDKSARKGSEAVRQNPLMREFFRERALSMQPSLRDNDRSMNTTVDFLLDDFVERSVKLAQKLSDNTEELYALLPRYRAWAAASNENGKEAIDQNLLRETRLKAEAIKSTTKSLEGQMDFLIQVLRLSIKVNDLNPSLPALQQIPSDIELIHTTVEMFRKSLNEFFFPKSYTVDLAEVQRAALPVQLKKVERYAERIEMLTRKMR